MIKPTATPRVTIPREYDVPKSAVDANGRLLPITPEEQQARAERIKAMFAEMAAIVDPEETDELWIEFMRGIDEARPHRKLFEGRY